jgi:hypothetical protein
MRNKIIAVGAVGMALSLFACLVAPTEPGSLDGPPACSANQQLFNGACRNQCTTTADCSAGYSCTNVGGGSPVCLAYTQCAYLDSDSACDAVPTNSYEGSYGSYLEVACVGNAKWVTTPASGDPSCGKAHPVSRCRQTANGCALVAGSTVDIGEP